jgi:Holliday junction resolvase-like predicted endonuclease
LSHGKHAFEPWRHNLRRRNFFIGALAAATANAALPIVDLGLQVNVILCAALASLAAHHHRRAYARQHGQAVEAKYGQLAKDRLESDGYNVVLGQRLHSGGDVDLVARKDGIVAVVELKSFRYWGARGQDGRREKKAVEQVIRQQEALSAKAALIWLPMATPTLWQLIWGYSFGGQGVGVVRGGARHLSRAIRRKT